jgi:hypothetical protein
MPRGVLWSQSIRVILSLLDTEEGCKAKTSVYAIPDAVKIKKITLKNEESFETSF